MTCATAPWGALSGSAAATYDVIITRDTTESTTVGSLEVEPNTG